MLGEDDAYQRTGGEPLPGNLAIQINFEIGRTLNQIMTGESYWPRVCTHIRYRVICFLTQRYVLLTWQKRSDF